MTFELGQGPFEYGPTDHILLYICMYMGISRISFLVFWWESVQQQLLKKQPEIYQLSAVSKAKSGVCKFVQVYLQLAARFS